MTEVILALLAILGITAAACIFSKNDGTFAAPFALLACVIGSLAAGMGFGIRQTIEGMFGYFDLVMAVLCAMIFVTILSENGALDYLFGKIVGKKRSAVLQTYLLLLFVMLPGIFTGTAAAGVTLVGGLAARYLTERGVDKEKAAGFVLAGALLGMLCPPISLVSAIAVQAFSFFGVFTGYALILLIIVAPAFIVYGISSSSKLKGFEPVKSETAGGFKCVIPLLVVVVLLILHEFFPGHTPFLGYPLIYAIGAVLAVLLGAKKFNILRALEKALRITAPVAAIVFVTGSAMNVFTSTGVSGTLALYLGRTDYRIVGLGVLVCVLAGGVYIGGQFGAMLTALGSYVMMNGFNSSGSVKMLGMSVALAVALAFPLRKGVLAELDGSLDEVKGRSGKLAKEAVIPIVLVLVMGVIALIFSAKLDAFRLPFTF